MASFDFSGYADDTSLETVDTRWEGDTTLLEVISGRLQLVSTGGGTERTAYFQNSHGAAQKCQVVIPACPGPRVGPLIQKNGSQAGYEARRSGVNTLELRRNGVYVTEGTLGGADFTANTYTIKIAIDGGGVVKIWAATGDVADAETSGTQLVSNTDGTPLTGGYPGLNQLSGSLVSDTLISKWTDFVSAAASPRRMLLLGVG